MRGNEWEEEEMSIAEFAKQGSLESQDSARCQQGFLESM